MAYEDFTTYTEEDAGGFIAISPDTKWTVTEVEREDTAYLYKDKGTGHFGDFEILYDFALTLADYVSPAGAVIYTILLANIYGTYADVLADDQIAITDSHNGGFAVKRHTLICRTPDDSDAEDINNAKYYYKFKRSSTTAYSYRYILILTRRDILRTLTCRRARLRRRSQTLSRPCWPF